jgi:hypothetical protein
MKTKIALMLAVSTMSLAPTVAMAYDKADHPGAALYEHSRLSMKALVEAPLAIVGSTVIEAGNMVKDTDNVLAVIPGAFQGFGLRLADAAESQIDAFKGQDTIFTEVHKIFKSE